MTWKPWCSYPYGQARRILILVYKMLYFAELEVSVPSSLELVIGPCYPVYFKIHIKIILWVRPVPRLFWFSHLQFCAHFWSWLCVACCHHWFMHFSYVIDCGYRPRWQCVSTTDIHSSNPTRLIIWSPSDIPRSFYIAPAVDKASLNNQQVKPLAVMFLFNSSSVVRHWQFILRTSLQFSPLS